MTSTPRAWWIETTWAWHRWTVARGHSLLVELEQARGTAFMTPERVVAVLDAYDPHALVRSWTGPPAQLLAVARRTRRLGLPTRLCAWTESDTSCTLPVRAVNAKFCEMHARPAGRTRHRKYNGKRGAGERQSCPPVALANQGVAEGEDPLPGSWYSPSR